MTPETEIEFEGVKQSIIDWALDYGIPTSFIIGRLNNGWTIANAITRPMRVPRGYRLSKLDVLAGLHGLNANTVRSRLRNGMSLAEALSKPLRHVAKPGVVANFPENVGDRSGVERAGSDENRDFEDKAA